ncbi:uncharacterized protein TNCV_1556551 [Trichonephila clavipes]|nr:uncharacterized protein TNCV_1556551 [Trichonephila clavipes]
MRLVKKEERYEAPDYHQGVPPQNWGETELNRSGTCMVLTATDNDRRHLALCHDEYHGKLALIWPLPIRRYWFTTTYRKKITIFLNK